jgi:hypothetical protein
LISWLLNVHTLEVNLILLRSEVIGAEGNLLVQKFSQILNSYFVIVRVRATFSHISRSESSLAACGEVRKYEQFEQQ